MALIQLPAFLTLALTLGIPGLVVEDQEEPTPGAIDVGDPYFPGVGNGGYDVEHYALDLRVDMESGCIYASAIIDARSTQALSAFNLDLYGLEVTAVQVENVAAKFEHEERELSITPQSPIARNAMFRTRVDYSGVPKLAPDASVSALGLKGTGWMTRETGVFTMSECVGAANWFPCNDHPIDKATFSMQVTVAKPYVVAANGILAEVVDNDDSRTYVWKANDPMATYLATVNISEFEVVIDEGGHDVFLRLYYPIGTSEKALEPFRRTSEMLHFFSDKFGDYPFEAFGGVLSSERLGGALETQTLAVYSRGVREGTVAHELVHQWFGNCVSVSSWKDLWLSEGFAVYGEWLWREHTRGREEMDKVAQINYSSAKAAGWGSPVDPGVHNVFGRRTYGRGPLVLYVLREKVGDEVFFSILKAWVDRNFNSTATTEDFVALCNDLAGKDLSEFFDAWLWGDRVPDYAPLTSDEPVKSRRAPRKQGQ